MFDEYYGDRYLEVLDNKATGGEIHFHVEHCTENMAEVILKINEICAYGVELGWLDGNPLDYWDLDPYRIEPGQEPLNPPKRKSRKKKQ